MPSPMPPERSDLDTPLGLILAVLLSATAWAALGKAVQDALAFLS